MGIESIVPVISAVGSLLGGAGSLGSIFGGGGRQNTPEPAPVQGPPATGAAAPDQTSFVRPAGAAAPSFLGLSSQMTPVQQRAAIATGAVGGQQSSFRDPATAAYYKNLVLNDLVGEGGGVKPGAQILPVEQQYVSQVLNQQPRADTPESFLSAVMRS